MNALNIPHIYAWESSGSYHGYGLATLALEQWRKYFYKKYGYIVDNPRVGKEMAKVWKLGARHTFSEFVKMSTGRKLSADAFLRNVTMTTPQILKRAKLRLARMEKVRPFKGRVDLNARVRLVHGKELIADNRKSFEDMAEKYKKWLATQVK